MRRDWARPPTGGRQCSRSEPNLPPFHARATCGRPFGDDSHASFRKTESRVGRPSLHQRAEFWRTRPLLLEAELQPSSGTLLKPIISSPILVWSMSVLGLLTTAQYGKFFRVLASDHCIRGRSHLARRSTTISYGSSLLTNWPQVLAMGFWLAMAKCSAYSLNNPGTTPIVTL
jgi:hypothetical protein